jgi:hypothetical protein
MVARDEGEIVVVAHGSGMFSGQRPDVQSTIEYTDRHSTLNRPAHFAVIVVSIQKLLHVVQRIKLACDTNQHSSVIAENGSPLAPVRQLDCVHLYTPTQFLHPIKAGDRIGPYYAH